MLGIKRYTDKMNQAAIQLTVDAHLFKIMNISIEYKTMLRKVDLFEKPHIITNWIYFISEQRMKTSHNIARIKKLLKKGGI